MINWKSKYLKYKLKYKKLNGGMFNSKSSSASKLNYPRPLNLSAEGDKPEKIWNYKPVKKRGIKTIETTLSSEQISPEKIEKYNSLLINLTNSSYDYILTSEQYGTYEEETIFKSIYEELKDLESSVINFVWGEKTEYINWDQQKVDKLEYLNEKLLEAIQKQLTEKELIKMQKFYIGFNNNLRLYFENIVDGNLLFYKSHSRLDNSVFKTKLNIIFLESVGVCTPSANSQLIVSKLKEQIINLNNNNKYFKVDSEEFIEEGSVMKILKNKSIANLGVKLRIHLPNTLINNQIITFNSDEDIQKQSFSPSIITEYKNIKYYYELYKTKKNDNDENLKTYRDYYNKYREQHHKYNLFDEKHYLQPELEDNLTLADICFSLEKMNFKGTIIFTGCRGGIQTTRQDRLSRMTSSINDSNINSSIISSISDSNISNSTQLSTQINYAFIFKLHINNSLNEKLQNEKFLIYNAYMNKSSMSYDLIFKYYLIINIILKKTKSKKITLNYFLNSLNNVCDYFSKDGDYNLYYNNCYQDIEMLMTDSSFININIIIKLIKEQIYSTTSKKKFREMSEINLNDYIHQEIMNLNDISIPEATDMLELEEFPQPTWSEIYIKKIITKMEDLVFGNNDNTKDITILERLGKLERRLTNKEKSGYDIRLRIISLKAYLKLRGIY
jgi:hypothetical protein